VSLDSRDASRWGGSTIRYRAGLIPLQIWLDAQEIRRQAENALAQNRLNRSQNYLTLCKALGGDPTRP
jgi:outer membrane protein TolC